MENIIAAVILIIAIVCIVALTAYRTYKKNNNSLTIENFINEYYCELVDALRDVVSILLINIDNYVDRETYEKAIISNTIIKLEENCSDFGIDTYLFNLFNRDIMTDVLYNLLHEEEIDIFTTIVPKYIIESKAELYTENVVNAAKETVD